MKKEMLLNTWAVFIYFLVQWALTVIVTRALGYIEAGIFTFAVTFTNIFSFFAKYGMRSFQVADVNRDYSFNQYISSRIVTITISVVFFAVAIILLKYDKRLSSCCIMMGVYKGLESIEDVAIGEMQVIHRYDWIAKSYTFKSIITLIVFCALIYFDVDMIICVFSMCFSFLLVMCIYDFRKVNMYKSYRWDAGNIKRLLKQCLPLTITSMLDALIIFIPKHFIEEILGSNEQGYYGTISLVIVILSTLASAIWGSLISRFSDIIKNHKWNDFKSITLKVSFCLLAFGFLAFGLGKLLGPLFFRIIFGEDILTHMFLLNSVLINSIFLMFNSFFICILIPMNKNSTLLYADVIAAIVCFVFSHFLTVSFGSVGASYGLSIALGVKLLFLIIATVFCCKNSMKG